MAKIVLKLTLGGLKYPPEVRVPHKTCSGNAFRHGAKISYRLVQKDEKRASACIACIFKYIATSSLLLLRRLIKLGSLVI